MRGRNRARTLVETLQKELSPPAIKAQTIMVEQLKACTVDEPLPWSRHICLAMSHHLSKGKLVALVGAANWDLHEEDLKKPLQAVQGNDADRLETRVQDIRAGHDARAGIQAGRRRNGGAPQVLPWL